MAIARIPPLRQRQLDLDLLIDHFLDQLAQDGVPPKLSTPARKYLLAQPWHGNVRELQNALRRASLWARGAKIQLADVRDELDDPRGPYSSDVMQRPLSESFRIDEILGEVESHYIKLALQQTGGNKARAAALLGLNNSTTLTNRMQKHGVI